MSNQELRPLMLTASEAIEIKKIISEAMIHMEDWNIATGTDLLIKINDLNDEIEDGTA